MKSLYKIALESLTHSDENLPEDVYFDVQKALFFKNHFIPVDAFLRLLNVTGRRMELHGIFPLNIKEALVDSGKKDKNKKLGEFFLEAGWYREAESVIKACIDGTSDPSLLFTYYTTLLKIHTADFNFYAAEKAFNKALEMGNGMNLGIIYSLKGQLLYDQGLFEEAYKLCSLAVGEFLNKGPINMPAIVSALKTRFLMMREDWEINFIENAVYLARKCDNEYKITYSDILEDYAIVLHRDKKDVLAIQAFKVVCKIREDVFGMYNLRTILAHLHLLSVNSYVKKHYFNAHARYEQLLLIMQNILPNNYNQHLLRAQRTEILLLKGMLTTMGTMMEELYNQL